MPTFSPALVTPVTVFTGQTERPAGEERVSKKACSKERCFPANVALRRREPCKGVIVCALPGTNIF